MKHYIMMRYNLGLFTSNPYNVENKSEWMDKRENLFFGYTLPSLLAQIHKDFILVLFFDPKTPYFYINDIEYELMHSGIEYKILTRNDAHYKFFGWNIYSRLDSDDIITPNYTIDIRNQADKLGEQDQLIDFKGVQFDIINNKQYTDGRSLPNSPFCSIVTNSKYIYDYEHTYLPNHFDNQVKLNKIGYYQILHDHNLANKPKGEEII